MKRNFLLTLILVSIISCTESKSSDDFIKATTGNYLFNSDEAIHVYYVNDEMTIKWRQNDNIKPLKINDSTFYMKEINERLIFISKPKMHIELAEKKEHKGVHYSFQKIEEGQKVPSEYLKNNELQKAITGYLAIQKKDSLDQAISEDSFNSLGYRLLQKNEVDKAIQIFTINTALYPQNSNTYDSLADAYWRKRDTVNAIKNYKKVLTIDSENKRAITFLKKHKLN